MIVEKLIELSEYYTKQSKDKDELTEFCNQFNIIFLNFRNEIELECNNNMFEMLDSIFMFCDLYEPNKEIRDNEPYCIGEDELQKKVGDILIKIKEIYRKKEK